jgi:ABC-type branched-subunit amino acid transport system substrate-binding protein
VTGLSAGACLSLTGRFAPFGRQAADGLRLWAEQSSLDLTIVDDESEAEVLTERLPAVAASTDLLFGPYSTVLLRAALPIADAAGKLLFNHGGSGGDLNSPGRVVNILTPACRYAHPFVAHLAGVDRAPLYVSTRRGAFGRDVVAGAVDAAQLAGLRVENLDLNTPRSGVWDLLSAGVYEDDVAAVRVAKSLPTPPRHICSVAAGVAQFADDIPNCDGVFGIGQWAPGRHDLIATGPLEVELLVAWCTRYNRTPDYPGIQAYAAGLLAQAAFATAGTVHREALWRAVATMDTATVFGHFRLDPKTGEQVGHQAVLTQWQGGRQVVV